MKVLLVRELEGVVTSSHRVNELAECVVRGRECRPAQDHLARPRSTNQHAARGCQAEASILELGKDALAGERPHQSPQPIGVCIDSRCQLSRRERPDGKMVGHPECSCSIDRLR